MKISKIILLILVILANNRIVSSQEELDSLYGLNPVLYNGQMYNSYLPQSIVGHQYLISDDFNNGTIDIGGKHFENVQINYDIYNQEVLLKFDLNKRTFIIKLYKGCIEKFEMDGKFFEVMNNENTDEFVVYQVIGAGATQVLYYWTKTLKLSTVSLQGSHVFSKPLKKKYIRIDGQTYRYSNNRNFISKFDESARNTLKSYMRSNKINVKKSSDSRIEELLKFCNTQLP